MVGTHASPVDATDALVWQASASANVTGYEIYMYSPDPTRDNSYVLIGETRGATTQYLLPFADAGTVQYFRVKAVTSTGARSAASSTVNASRTAFGTGGGQRGPGQGMHEGVE